MCRRNGPNSSPNQRSPWRSRRTDSTSKSAPVRQALGGVLVDELERDPAARVAQRDPVEDLDVAAAARGGLQRAHAVEPQQERARVGLGAEAVVGHREVGVAAGRVEQRGEAADGLARAGRGRGLGVRGARERRGSGGVGGQDGAPGERRRGSGGGGRDGEGREEDGGEHGPEHARSTAWLGRRM